MRNSLQRWPVATIRDYISYNLPNDDEKWVAETLLRLIDLEKANLAQNIKKSRPRHLQLRRPALLVLDS